MGGRKIYLTLIIVGAVVAVSGILMKWSSHPSLQSAGLFVGWAGIALLLIARISFAVKRRQQPPSPRS